MPRRSGGTLLDHAPPGDPISHTGSPPRRARRGRDRPGAPPSAPDPAAGSGEESRRTLTRRERRRRAARRRRILVVVPALAVLVFAVFLVGKAVRGTQEDTEPAAPRTGATGATTSVPRTVLLEHRAVDGRTDLLVLVGATRRKSRAAALMIPAATLAEVPSLGVEPLQDVPTLGEPGLLTTTIENLLGVRVGSTATVDDAGLAAALAPAAPITVDLRDEVQVSRPEGEVIVPAGEQSLSADDAALLLTTAEPRGEIQHLVTVQAVLEGWLERLGDPDVADATLEARPDLGPLVAAAAASPRISTLPVDSLSTQAGERFEVRLDEAERFARTTFPDAVLGSGGRRPRVEIVNGTGAVGVAQGVAQRIVPEGGRVADSGNAPGFGVDETQVIYYRERDRRVAEEMLDALGCGRLARAGRELDVFDVTILVGADCPEL